MKNKLNKQDIKAFEPENKVGLLATVDEEGLPHITLITTLQAKDEGRLVWGQFSEGKSKTNVVNNPKTGFLIMTMDRNLWRGKAEWTHSVKEGADYEKFNNLPMWRYNSYFGIHTIHYMDLIETTPKSSLPLLKIILSSLLTKLSKGGALKANDEEVMNPWTESLFNRLNTLKFLSYVGKKGYPVIIPLLQCQAAGSDKLAFNPGAYHADLKDVPPDCNIAVFGLTLDMEDVLLRGKFQGFKRYRGVKLGVMDIDWIYNSMPPISGQIYPKIKTETVVDF